MNETLLNIISVLVTSVILPLIIYYGNKLKEFLKTKTSNEKLKLYLDQATNAVTLAVASTAQTYVDTLKKSGDFTQEAHKVAFDMAKEQALKLIKEDAKNAIEAIYGDFNEWLTALIETKVKEIK